MHGRSVKTTRYFAEQVLRKRPYLPTNSFAAILAAPLRRTVQPDGRIRCWGAVIDPRDGKRRILRLVTLEDGETIHNAFYDSRFREGGP